MQHGNLGPQGCIEIPGLAEAGQKKEGHELLEFPEGIGGFQRFLDFYLENPSLVGKDISSQSR